MKGSVRNSADVIEYPLLWKFAKENRNNPTEAERLLWFYISNKQLGVWFRRQYIIGQYIADFACLEKMHYPEAVLDWLSTVTSINFDVAYVLVNSIDEFNIVTKNKGSRIWMPLHNVLNEKDPIQFYIYLYRLSFNWNDQDALAYMRKAFYPIHQLLLQEKLEYNLWYSIEPYTEHLFFLQNWDKCKRMRKMVIRRLKEAGFTKSTVNNYTPDDKVNDWLLKEW